MRWILRIFYVVLLIALVLVAVAFLTANGTAYQLGFLDWKTFESTVGVFVLLSFVLGALIGLFSGLPIMLGMRLKIRALQNKLTKAQPTEPHT